MSIRILKLNLKRQLQPAKADSQMLSSLTDICPGSELLERMSMRISPSRSEYEIANPIFLIFLIRILYLVLLISELGSELDKSLLDKQNVTQTA